MLQQNAATGGAAGAPLEVSGLLTFEVSSDDALRVIDANNGGRKPVPRAAAAASEHDGHLGGDVGEHQVAPWSPTP